MMFYFLNTANRLVCLLIVHVDDFLISYSEKLYDPTGLFGAFQWGTLSHAPDPIMFPGKQIEVLPGHRVKVHQRDYTEVI